MINAKNHTGIGYSRVGSVKNIPILSKQILSQTGSSILPHFEFWFSHRAVAPSRKSVMAANPIKNAAQIFPSFFDPQPRKIKMGINRNTREMLNRLGSVRNVPMDSREVFD